MNKLLKDLYDCFYTPPELAATKREIEECHRALIEALGKPEHRLVLKIIDVFIHKAVSFPQLLHKPFAADCFSLIFHKCKQNAVFVL